MLNAQKSVKLCIILTDIFKTAFLIMPYYLIGRFIHCLYRKMRNNPDSKLQKYSSL